MQNKIRKITVRILLTVMVLFAGVGQGMDVWAYGTWIQETNGTRWWYKNDDGTYPASTWKEIDDEWYYFDSEGWMLTYWQKIGDYWYFFGLRWNNEDILADN